MQPIPSRQRQHHAALTEVLTWTIPTTNKHGKLSSQTNAVTHTLRCHAAPNLNPSADLQKDASGGEGDAFASHSQSFTLTAWTPSTFNLTKGQVATLTKYGKVRVGAITVLPPFGIKSQIHCVQVD